jgi:hypothetical protein
MSRPTYIPGPSTRGSAPIFIPGDSWDRGGASPVTVILATLIILTIIVILTIYIVRRMKRETITLTSGEDLLDLSTLVNLRTDGQCCLPPSAVTTTQEWIYSPSNDFTYSSTKTEPAIVCQGLTGLDLNTCLSYVSDANGDPKILAHYGVKPYYAFSPGTAGGVCASYGTC